MSNGDLPDLFEVRINGSPETLAKVLAEFALDFGCRHPHAERRADGTFSLLVYAGEERVRELRGAGYDLTVGDNVSELGRRRQAEVGRGDRFDSGRRAPSGFGAKGGAGQDEPRR